MNQIYGQVKKLNMALPLILFAGILAFAAYLRFLNLTNEGMTGCDTFAYWTIGKLWAEGNYTFTEGGAEFFRPAAYYLHSIAFKMFGLNDYAIKLMHASMDTLNIGLVFAIGAIIGRSLWIGVSSSILYAFLPRIIGYSRQELIHIPSATFVLLSIFFYLLFDTIQKKRMALGCLFLVLSGASLSIAAGMHPDLAVLGACFIPFIFLSTFSKEKKVRSLGKFVFYSFVFTVSVFSLYIVSGYVMGFERVRDMLLMRAGASKTIEMAFLEQTLLFMTKGMKGLTSTRMVYLFLGTPVLMIILWIKKFKTNATAYIPWVFWLGYGLLFELLMRGCEYGQLFRILIPLVPLVAIGIVYWYTKTFEMITRRRWIANVVVLLGCVVLAWFNFGSYRSSLALQKAHYQTQFRGVYDVLKDKMDHNKLFVTPYLVDSHLRGFQQEMYFGNKALYIIDFQDPAKSLDDIVRENKIKYIYVGKRDLDERLLNHKTFKKHDLNNPSKAESVPLILGACYGMNSKSYSLDSEYKILNEFISGRRGQIIWQSRDGILYKIDRIAREGNEE